MVRKDKVALMTRLAIEEKHDTRQTFITESFWFNDYVTKELWEAFFAISFAFCLTVLLGLVAYGDSWTVTYHIADVAALAVRLLKIYVPVLLLGLLLGLISHIVLYREAKARRKRADKYLKKLARYYRAEEALRRARL